MCTHFSLLRCVNCFSSWESVVNRNLRIKPAGNIRHSNVCYLDQSGQRSSSMLWDSGLELLGGVSMALRRKINLFMLRLGLSIPQTLYLWLVDSSCPLENSTKLLRVKPQPALLVC